MQVETCQLCGKRVSVTYTCEQCKRDVCETCFKHETNVCSQCCNRRRDEMPLLTFPLKLFLLGFALIFLGTIFLIASTLYGNVQPTTGIVILIGPIPIILGIGPYSTFVIILATIITILSIVIFLLLLK